MSHDTPAAAFAHDGRVPMVSVCIPTYNGRESLGAILCMVRGQTFRDFEIIVCDDGATDGTFEYLASLKWPELTVLRNSPNLFYPGTMARLFGAARGKYIAIAHDHDPVQPEWLEKMVALMESNPGAGMGCCACRVLDGQGRIVEDPPLGLWQVFQGPGALPGRRFLKVLAEDPHTPIAVVGSLFAREVMNRAGGYCPEWYLAADEDLYRRVAAVSDVAFCPERLFTLATRPPASGKRMGGWRSIYTLSEFRRDTAEHFLQAGWAGKRCCVLRLLWLKQVALWKESVSRWLRGDMEGLAEALRSDVVPKLPTGRPPLGGLERTALSCMILVLRATRPLGRALGGWRHGDENAHGA